MPEFPFSNFQYAPVFLDGVQYPTVEHAFQAAKTHVRGVRQEILLAATPGRAKRLGRKAPLRQDWEEIKLLTMENLLRQKYAPGTENARQLALYQGEIVEWNTWHDQIWGVCSCAQCGSRGQNHLGRLLSKLRQELNAQP